MDDYENIFNGAGSAPTAAGGAASLGPDAAGYAPTAAATPTPMSAAEAAKYDKIPVLSPVDSLAPQAMEQVKNALSLGASELSPANRQRWMPSNAQLGAFGSSPVSPSRNLSDGVFAQGAAQRPLPEWAKQSPEELLREFYRDRFIQRWSGPQKTPSTLTEALGGGESIKTLVEGLLNARGGNPATEGMVRQAAPAPNAPSAQSAPEPPLPQFTPARGSDGKERNGYDYNGVRVELPAGFDTSDPAKTAAQVSFSNQMVDWMTNDDDEMEV